MNYTIRKDVLGDVSRKTSFDAVRIKLGQVQPAAAAKVLEVGGSNGIIRSMFPESVEYTVAPDYTEFIPPDEGVNILKLPYADAQYDFIIVDNVLEHVKDLQTAVSELYRVCRPGGLVIALTPFITNFHAGRACGDYWRISPLGYKQLFSKFSKVEAYGWGDLNVIKILNKSDTWNVGIDECSANERKLLDLTSIKPVESDEIVNSIKTTGGLYNAFFVFTWCFAQK